MFKKADEAIIVNSIYADNVLLNLKTNATGATNYDITKVKENASTETSSFAFDIEDYQIKNSTINYLSEESNILFKISEFNHEGTGTFSAEKSELNTKSDGKISLSMDGSNYLINNPIKLDALIGLDLENSKYTFKENKGFINQLPIEFHGFVQLLEVGQDSIISLASLSHYYWYGGGSTNSPYLPNSTNNSKEKGKHQKQRHGITVRSKPVTKNN